ncbi:MAG: glycosyltransferase family 2 protein, partial [Pseudomonadota bacterium]
SLDVIKSLQQYDANIKIINFTRNFGHETAMTAGIDHAQGDAVLFMDGDGQNPPHIAIEMIKKWLEGYDVILTKRCNYKRGWFSRMFRGSFWWLFNLLSDVKFDAECPDFRLLSRKYVNRIKQIDEGERMFRGLLHWIGIQNYTVIDFEVPKRLSGSSSYNFFRYANLGISGILQFSIKPLRVFTIVTVIACTISIGYAGFVFYDHMVNDRPQSGFATIVIIMILLFSVQTFIIALIGEYVGRIHMEVKKRPLYFADVIEHRKQVKHDTKRLKADKNHESN